MECRLSKRLFEWSNGLAVKSHQSRTNNETKQTTSNDGQNSPTHRSPERVKRWTGDEIKNRGDRDGDEKHLHDKENLLSPSIAPSIAIVAKWSGEIHGLVAAKDHEK